MGLSVKGGRGSSGQVLPSSKVSNVAKRNIRRKDCVHHRGGTGLGKGIALTLSSLGANVVIAARRTECVEETANEITGKTGNPVLPVQMDVRDPEKIKAAFDACEAKLGVPTVIINNAAGNLYRPSERLSANAWKTITDIVLNGTAFVTLEAGKRLIKAQKVMLNLLFMPNFMCQV
ncbi:UNVERIFIED_CONTAM: hypothetical protein GTU68_030040 [Idotea baltica]|nr:hypothetical protein [Idotea baltica]